MLKIVKIGLCGIQGYAGKELMKLVLAHPYLQLAAVFTDKSAVQLQAQIPGFAKLNIAVIPTNAIAQQQIKLDVILLATPVEVSINLISHLQHTNIKVIDLSAAFRLPLTEFNHWYQSEHLLPELINNSHYGLLPWNQAPIKNYSLIANPGCYATCALMALLPLIKNHVINNNTIVIDAKSGVSGAGKKANPELMYGEMAENFFPYKIAVHQHIPEIKNALKNFTDQDCNFTLVTHMLPLMRGISLSIYADAATHFNCSKAIAAAITVAYQTAYADYPLVDYAEINRGNPEKDKFLLSLKTVIGTAKVHIGYVVDGKKVLVFACIDNLLKGAASQAIENINALHHWPIATGLLTKEYMI